ncbi:MAG: NUDIX hydrolase [Candidatus Methanodesulfokora sp.]
MEPRVERDELICSGRRVKLYRRIISGGIVKDLVSFGKAVVIVPVLSDGRIVFVRQWRAPIAKWIVELPAGRIEEGEEPLETAIRELKEETGYRAGRIKEIASAYVAPGYSDEYMHIFVAEDLVFEGQRPEKGEYLMTVVLSPEEYISKFREDMKSIAALLLYLWSRKSTGDMLKNH